MGCTACALSDVAPTKSSILTGAIVVAGLLGLVGFILYDRKRIPRYN